MTKGAAATLAAGFVTAMVFAPAAAADPTATLRSAVDSARSEAGCPPLQSDPRLEGVSLRVAHEITDYVKHTARFLPTTGENDLLATGGGGVQPLMREVGYNTNKVKLLLGYGDYRTGGPGDNEAKAIKALVLQGQGSEVFPDCAYTSYGVAAINEDSLEGWPSTAPRTYAVTAAVVAGG